MPNAAGLADSPVCRALVTYLVVSSIVVTATDTKYYFQLMPDPHLFGTPYSGQWWRLLVWPFVYTNSTEMLFGAMSIYQMRTIERIWGSRKFSSFLISIALWVTILPPTMLLTLRPITAYRLNFLPAGPTAFIFAAVAQYQAAIPYTFRYRVATASVPPSSNEATTRSRAEEESNGILLTSKSVSYLLPLQLAFSQFPGSLIPAIVGWAVGYLWRVELLPTLPGRSWRVPAWMVGEKATSIVVNPTGTSRGGESLESLRRRMQEEQGTAETSGVAGDHMSRRRA